MTFEIEIDGERRTVSIEQAGAGHYRVLLDGQSHVVSAERVDEFGISLVLDRESGRSREVQVAPGTARGEVLVSVAGLTVPVVVNGRSRGRASTDAAGHSQGAQPVTAPMPGRVVRVLVAPGDAVAVRQSVVVVEAMKMENELRSPKAGTVKDVTVTPGMSVEAGRVLVVVE